MNIFNQPKSTLWFSVALIQTGLSYFGLLAACLAAVAVLTNISNQFISQHTAISGVFFIAAFLAAFLPRPWGFMGVICALPLVANLHFVINSLFGLTLIAMPNHGLDLVAGLFLGTALLFFAQAIGLQKSSYAPSHTNLMARKNDVSILPWPVGLVILVVTISTAIAIVRNLRQSATHTSLNGLLYNLIHFRPIDWHADYMPMGDWVAYCLAGALIALAIINLRNQVDRNAILFRPLMLGLVIAVLMGLIQSLTGFGLPEPMRAFRKDLFGFAALGFQPDIHAYAGHMLLGAVGLWGFFLICKSKLEKKWILIVIALSWVGLFISKSRASLIFALIVVALGYLTYLKQVKSKRFNSSLVVIATLLVGFFIAIGLLYKYQVTIPGLGWINDLLIQMRGRSLMNLSDLSGVLGSRIEIWAGAIRMFLAFPLMGVGQGSFYREAANVVFSRSYFMEFNHGENAHNYFLQTLTETGLVGFSVFLLVFLIPLYQVRPRTLLYPAIVGLGGLFLGNIFAHSFLVRENLMLGAALLGLMYSFTLTNNTVFNASEAHYAKSTVPYFVNRSLPLIGITLGAVIFAALLEVYSSFYRFPYLIGIDCFVSRPVSLDGWTSGVLEIQMPQEASGRSSGIEMELEAARPNLARRPLTAQLDFIARDLGSVGSTSVVWTANGVQTLRLAIPPSLLSSTLPITARLRLSSCYTPRDLAVNLDSRRLGVRLIKPVIFLQ